MARHLLATLLQLLVEPFQQFTGVDAQEVKFHHLSAVILSFCSHSSAVIGPCGHSAPAEPVDPIQPPVT